MFQRILGALECLRRNIRPSASLIKTRKQSNECLSRKRYTNQEHEETLRSHSRARLRAWRESTMALFITE